MRERIDLAWQFGVVRHRRWRTGSLNGWDEVFLSVGVLQDGRWWVHHTRRRDALLCADARDAAQVVGGVLRPGQWWRWPAEFDGSNRPTEPGWRRSGQWWFRDDEPELGPAPPPRS